MENPSDYSGSFTIEIWNGAKTDHVPSSARIVDENKISVTSGRFHNALGGIQFDSYGQSFSFHAYYIRRITNPSGQIIWRNWQDKDEPAPAK